MGRKNRRKTSSVVASPNKGPPKKARVNTLDAFLDPRRQAALDPMSKPSPGEPQPTRQSRHDELPDIPTESDLSLDISLDL